MRASVWSVVLLSLVCLLVQGQESSHGDGNIQLVITHFEAVTNFRLHHSRTGSGALRVHQGRVNEKNHTQEYDEELFLSFSAFNRTLQFTLQADHGLFHQDSSFDYYNGGKMVDRVKPSVIAYIGSNEQGERIHVTILDESTIHATYRLGDDRYFLTPLSVESQAQAYFENQLATSAVPALPTMAVYSEVDVQGGSEQVQASAARKLSAFDIPPIRVWNDCWYGEQRGKSLVVGVAVNAAYHQVAKVMLMSPGAVDVMKRMTFNINYLNAVFSEQIHISLVIGPTRIYSSYTAGDPAWNDEYSPMLGCQNNYYSNDMLRMPPVFGRATVTDPAMRKQAGAWFVMTGCRDKNGYGGAAFINAACDPDRNGAVVGFKETMEWVMLAHEIGHVLGAHHSFEDGRMTTGGIMDYAGGFYKGRVQFNDYRREEMCEQINKSINKVRSGICWVCKDCDANTPTTAPTPPPTPPTPPSSSSPNPCTSSSGVTGQCIHYNECDSSDGYTFEKRKCPKDGANVYCCYKE